jgi:hypothetical protein
VSGSAALAEALPNPQKSDAAISDHAAPLPYTAAFIATHLSCVYELHRT